MREKLELPGYIDDLTMEGIVRKRRHNIALNPIELFLFHNAPDDGDEKAQVFYEDLIEMLESVDARVPEDVS